MGTTPHTAALAPSPAAGEAPLGWIAERLPQLRELRLGLVVYYDRITSKLLLDDVQPTLSSDVLPPGLRRLEVETMCWGLEGVVGQLESLHWNLSSEVSAGGTAMSGRCSQRRGRQSARCDGAACQWLAGAVSIAAMPLELPAEHVKWLQLPVCCAARGVHAAPEVAPMPMYPLCTPACLPACRRHGSPSLI